MASVDSPFLYFEHNELTLEEDRTDVKLEIKPEYVEIKEEKCDVYSTHDVQSSTVEGNDLGQNINAAESDVNIVKDFKKSDVPKWQKERKCSLCDFVTNSRYKFKRHVVDIHNTGAYECPNCDYKTHMKRHLKHHLMLKTACQVRLARLKKLDQVEIPKEFCTKQESGFKCIYCDYNSPHKYMLKKHVHRVHLQLKHHSCSHCEFKTPYKMTLESHMVRKHPEQCNPSELENKVCHLCGKMYSLFFSLQRHMQIEHFNEKIRCTLCDYTCVRNKELVFHMKRFHEQKKLFQCHDCGYTAPRKLILREHILGEHLKLEEYTCDMCSFKTLYRKTLIAHKKIHSCLERLTCKYCSFITLSSKALEKHNRVQHNDCSLKCDQCDYVTFEKYLLLRHVDCKHNKIEYTCQICGKYGFKYRGSLLSHMYKVHGQQPLKRRRKVCEQPNLDIDTEKVEEIEEQSPEKLKMEDCKDQIKQEIKIETVYIPSFVDYQEDIGSE